MSDDELRATVKKIVRAVREADNGKTSPIKSCVIMVPGHQQICLPNVKFAEECNQIGRLLINSGYEGTTAMPNKNSGCNSDMHTVLRTPRRPKAKKKP